MITSQSTALHKICRNNLKFLDTIVIEIRGLEPEERSINYWALLAKLQSLRYLSYEYFRKTIFECMNLVGDIEQ